MHTGRWRVRSPSVHPHMRGEHEIHIHRLTLVVRFIPTCVGSISYIGPPSASCTVHPHMRGEHDEGGLCGISDARFIPTCVGSIFIHRLTIGVMHGSSPHAWGAFHTAYRPAWSWRFIPTCVGSILVSIQIARYCRLSGISRAGAVDDGEQPTVIRRSASDSGSGCSTSSTPSKSRTR